MIIEEQRLDKLHPSIKTVMLPDTLKFLGTSSPDGIVKFVLGSGKNLHSTVGFGYPTARHLVWNVFASSLSSIELTPSNDTEGASMI